MAQFEKGQSGNPNGRKRGEPNKLTKTVKDCVLNTFLELQNDPKYDLMAFAKKFPKEFYQISAKLIPQDIKAQVESVSSIKIIRE